MEMGAADTTEGTIFAENAFDCSVFLIGAVGQAAAAVCRRLLLLYGAPSYGGSIRFPPADPKEDNISLEKK